VSGGVGILIKMMMRRETLQLNVCHHNYITSYFFFSSSSSGAGGSAISRMALMRPTISRGSSSAPAAMRAVAVQVECESANFETRKSLDRLKG
jgi:hypothetical protein